MRSSTADATFSGFVTNQWYFFAATYDGSSLIIYAGTETTPAAVVSTTSLSGLTAALGTSAYLTLGNRSSDRSRGLDGWDRLPVLHRRGRHKLSWRGFAIASAHFRR